eukprot:XP_001705849.1 Hypothetical protein GL50803_36617 [Giardia lamblia ATCC 50803]
MSIFKRIVQSIVIFPILQFLLAWYQQSHRVYVTFHSHFHK